MHLQVSIVIVNAELCIPHTGIRRNELLISSITAFCLREKRNLLILEKILFIIKKFHEATQKCRIA